MKTIVNVDPGGQDLKPGHVWLYYVDGFRRYIGTVKFHLSPECHVIQNHRPNRFESDQILKASYPASMLGPNVCKFCKRKS